MSAQTVTEPQAASSPTTFKLSAAQSIERLIVVVALVGLTLTGLPQKYSTESWAHILIVLGGGIESLRILHRIFGVLLLAETLYHGLAVAFRWFVMGQRWVMLPGVKVVGALVSRVLANIGLRRNNTPNYNFALKLEYLIIAIAIVVLGITGLMLWNPIAVTNIFSGEIIPAARSLHSNHALFTIVILVLLRLGIVLLWHPRRASIFAEQPAAAVSAEHIQAHRQTFMPIAVIAALVVIVGFVLFITSEQTAISTVPRRQAIIFAPQIVPDEGDPNIGAVLWETTRCALCHGANAEGGINGEPSLRRADLTFDAFYEQVRIGRGDMPSFTTEELPDGYLVHLWAWLTQPAS